MLSPSVCSADFVTFLQVAQLCLRDITSAPLLWSSSQCAGIHSSDWIIITACRAAPALPTGLCAQHTLLSSRRPSGVSARPCLPPCAQGYYVAHVLCLMSGPMFCFWCPFQSFPHWVTPHVPPCWNSAQALLNPTHRNPVQFYLGVLLLSPHLFFITASPLGQMSWSLTKHILFSLWEMLSILRQISVIPTVEATALK